MEVGRDLNTSLANNRVGFLLREEEAGQKFGLDKGNSLDGKETEAKEMTCKAVARKRRP